MPEHLNSTLEKPTFKAPSFFDWFQTNHQNTMDIQKKSWLIFGKGPSFSLRHQYDFGNYHTIALNHVIREQPADFSHVIDFDVVEDCGDFIERNAQFLVMPWTPHINLRPTELTLMDLMARNKTLQTLYDMGRLLWYNLSTSKTAPREHCPIVKSGYYSAEVVVNLMVANGVRRIRTLGVDGGTRYSDSFQDLDEKTRLSNAHESYDKQFAGIAQNMLHQKLDYAPLHLESPVKVFVGSEPEQELAVQVLAYSLQKTASIKVEVTPLYSTNRPIPMPDAVENRPRTHFSFQRFLIPELCNYQGRAIYLDSDMLVLQDITSLWTWPFQGSDLLCVKAAEDSMRKPQFSVLVLDCEKLKWNIESLVTGLNEGNYTYTQLMHEMVVAQPSRTIYSTWNSLEQYAPNQTALIHYTDVPTQPWISKDNLHGAVWIEVLIEAVNSGYIQKSLLKDSLRQGHIRPSLYYQVKHGIADPAQLPSWMHHLDHDFLAPYQLLKHPKKRFLKECYRKLARIIALIV